MENYKNTKIKSIIKSFGDSYSKACEDSWIDAVSMMKPAQAAPVKGVIYGDANRKKFEEDCTKYRAEALSIINSELDSCNKMLSKAPSTEAVNSITLLSMRGKDSVTPEEVDRLIDTYGSNFQAFKTIVSVARDKGIRTNRVNPAEEKIESMKGLSRAINSTLSLRGAEAGHASEGFLALLRQSVDSAFPEE